MVGSTANKLIHYVQSPVVHVSQICTDLLQVLFSSLICIKHIITVHHLSISKQHLTAPAAIQPLI